MQGHRLVLSLCIISILSVFKWSRFLRFFRFSGDLVIFFVLASVLSVLFLHHRNPTGVPAPGATYAVWWVSTIMIMMMMMMMMMMIVLSNYPLAGRPHYHQAVAPMVETRSRVFPGPYFHSFSRFHLLRPLYVQHLFVPCFFFCACLRL